MARLGERRGAYRVLVGKLKVRDHWEDQGVNARTVKLRLTETGHEGLDQSGLVQGEVLSCFEHVDKP